MNSTKLFFSLKDQLDYLKGRKYNAEIVSDASTNRGVLSLSYDNQTERVGVYDSYQGEVQKFVPASGAATRMFKHVNNLEDPKNILAQEFLEMLTEMPFYDQLNELCLKRHSSSALALISSNRTSELKKLILDKEGLNFYNLPKGLIPFHKYREETRNAFMEQVIEGMSYLEKNGNCTLHFTVSPDHKSLIKNELDRFLQGKNLTNVIVNYSRQLPETNTIALTKSGEILTEEGDYLLRPGGHGALIHNLNSIDADLVFIKNIDNVVKESNLSEQAHWKKVLAGHLLVVQNHLFKLMNEIISGRSLEEAKTFLKDTFYYDTDGLVADDVKALLNRPLRVCGMVENEGQPGGGPFFVKHKYGQSLQIVESAEIDKTNESHLASLNRSTHFNPVDIVCGVKDHEGKKFDLLNYVNSEACFTSFKDYKGSEIKVLELPGLWNGGMAEWNTIFIEVPASTFSPVKTVNDLAKTEHLVHEN